MESNDYIGNMSNSRWQSMNASYLNRTPSWMQARMPRAQQRAGGGATFRAPNSGATQSWDGGQMHPSLLNKSNAMNDVATGFGKLSTQLGENYDQQQAQQAQQQAQAQQNQQAGQQIQNAYQNLPNQANVANLKNQYLNAFKPSPAPALPSKAMPPPAPGMQPFGTPSQNQAFPAPGTPAPAPQPLTPLQQQAVAGVPQNKAQSTSTTPAGQPSNPLPPMQRPAPVMATNRPPRTPANKPAKTRAQRRTMGAEAIGRIRESLNNPNLSI